jgi:hypothetical protein
MAFWAKIAQNETEKPTFTKSAFLFFWPILPNFPAVTRNQTKP